MSFGEIVYLVIVLAVVWWAADMLGLWEALRCWLDEEDEDPPRWPPRQGGAA